MGEWLDTARALKAHADCPKGLVQHVVSCGAAQVACGPCSVELTEDEADDGFCPQCESGEGLWTTGHPDADRVPDLSSGPRGLANAWPLMHSFCTGRTAARLVRRPGFGDRPDGYHATIDGISHDQCHDAAHAAAVAWLAWRGAAS